MSVIFKIPDGCIAIDKTPVFTGEGCSRRAVVHIRNHDNSPEGLERKMCELRGLRIYNRVRRVDHDGQPAIEITLWRGESPRPPTPAPEEVE